MSMVEKSNMSSISEWGQDVQPYFRTFSRVIAKAPMSQLDTAHKVALEIWQLLEAFQQTDCPKEAIKIHNQFVRAALNLFMCYNAIATNEWDSVAVYFECAVIDWDYTQKALCNKGLHHVSQCIHSAV